MDKVNARIQDVAAAADVSVATVSRYFNAPELLSGAARQRVRLEVERLHYVPQAAARALVLGQSKLVGAIVPTIENSLFSSMVSSFQERLKEEGYSVLLGLSEYSEEQEATQISSVLGAGAEALLLIGSSRAESTYEKLKNSRKPFITALAYAKSNPYANCGFDQEEAISEVVEHLVRHGHRKFAFISGHLQPNDRAATRLSGVISSLGRYGLTLNEDCLVTTNYSISNGRAATARLLAGPRPTAIITGNDLLAVGALLECAARKVSVPRSLSVVGFGNLEIGREVSPPLTTVEAFYPDIGSCSADYLLGALAGRKKIRKRIKLKTELLVRESSGPAPNSG